MFRYCVNFSRDSSAEEAQKMYNVPVDIGHIINHEEREFKVVRISHFDNAISYVEAVEED